MTAIMIVAAAESFLTKAFLWGGFTLLVVAVVSLPATTTRDWLAMVPWPLLSLAAIAVVAKALHVYPEIAGDLAIAALALIVVINLDVYTSVELSRRFVVVFCVLTTMALEALWIIVQFYSDSWLGTGFLRSQTELQENIVVVTAVGFAVGALFYWYFMTFAPAGTVDL